MCQVEIPALVYLVSEDKTSSLTADGCSHGSRPAAADGVNLQSRPCAAARPRRAPPSGDFRAESPEFSPESVVLRLSESQGSSKLKSRLSVFA